MKLVSVSEMRAIEQEADSSGLTYSQMMENAGSGLADAVIDMIFEEDEQARSGWLGWTGKQWRRYSCCTGSSGSQRLAGKSLPYWNRPLEKDPLMERLGRRAEKLRYRARMLTVEMLSAFIGSATVIMDGILGTGFKLPLKKEISEVMQAVNTAIAELDWPPYVVAVDCPSGVNCDTGEAVEDAIPASITVTMAAVKQGLIKFPAFELVGDLQVVDIGLTNEISGWTEIRDEVADDDLVSRYSPGEAG